MKKVLLLAIMLCAPVVAFAGNTKDSTSIVPRNLTQDPSLSGKTDCTTVNQRWNVDASASGRSKNISVGIEFDDVDASTETANCSVSLTGYDGSRGRLTVKAKGTASTCLTNVTFCAVGGTPSCSGGSICNPAPTPPPSMCPTGYTCACSGDIKISQPDYVIDYRSTGGYRISRRGTLGPYYKCP